MKRRTAAAKINSLPFATEEELKKHDDVCAICYQDMLQAKITKCKHFFHSMCLRKWLYMQDTCPLCHAVLYKDITKIEPETDLVENIDANEAENSDNEDVMDLDDPPFQAPPVMEDSNSDSSDSESTGLVSSTDEDLLLFENPDSETHSESGEEDLIHLMDRHSSTSSDVQDHGDDEEVIDR